MTKPEIAFIFDFGSPNAWLAMQVLPAIAEKHGAAIRLVPCLLGGIFKLTGNRAPMVAFSEIKGKNAYERLEFERFIRKHGLIRFRFNPHFPVNTLLAMRGMIAAQRLGVEQVYTNAVLTAMWENRLKMDDSAVFSDVLSAAGLDGQAILALTQDSGVKDELMANTEAAVARGVFGIPTFFVGTEMFFGKERLGQIDELLAAGA